MFNRAVHYEIHRVTETVLGKKQFVNTGRLISGTVIPIDSDFAQLSAGSLSKSFEMRSNNANADVQDGDRIVHGSEQYEVRGVRKHTYGLKHLLLTLELCN